MKEQGLAPGDRPPRRRRDDGVDMDLARRLYVSDGLSLRETAKRLDTKPDKLRADLCRAGVELRPPGRRPSTIPLDRPWLVDLYTVQRLSHEEIADAGNCSVAHVRNELRRHSIARHRGPGPLRVGWLPLTAELLEELYVNQALTVSEVAQRVGGSDSRVLAGLRRAAIPTRAPGTPSGRRLTRLTPELLHQLYVVEGLSAAQVGKRVGGDGKRVWAALVRAGIPRRPRNQPPRRVTASREDLVEAWVTERASIEELSERYGTSAYQVRLRLRAEGIRRSPPGGPSPAKPALEELARLYVEEGHTLAQLAEHHHVDRGHVRAWLVEADVTIAPRTTRSHRRELPVQAVTTWYWDQGCTSAEIAERLGTTNTLVLRCLHDAGIPVRLGASHRELPPV